MSNSPYIVSARKYRPATFKSVVGQKNLTDTLKNAIDTGRLAQAYLFCGPRGVGKTSCARIFAKTINCLNPTPDGEACGECESCKAIQTGNSYNIVELDAASNNGVEDIRQLTQQVNVPPAVGKYRVFIIDEVHMLSAQAFNAFLKTLEEPPAYVIFILATTEKHKVIPTILSRCQIYDFKRISIQDMVEHLQYVAQSEGITADVPSLNVIAKKADGAMRDALSIFDQVAASAFGTITYESTIASLNVLDYDYYFRLVEAFRTGDVPEALVIYKEIRDAGFDSLFFINGLASHIRDLMVAYSPKTVTLLEVAQDIASKYTEQAQSMPVEWHYAAMKILNQCDFAYRTASDKQFLVELTLIKLCQLLSAPKAPFDNVDNELFPLRDIVVPQTAGSPEEPHPVAQSPAPTISSTPETSKDDAENRNPVRRARRVKQSSGGSTFRLNDVSQAQSDGNNDPEKEREPVTLPQFTAAWQAYADANPDKQILISAIRQGTPEQTSPESFTYTVHHPASYQAFEQNMPHLVEYLRDTLHNRMLTLEIKLAEDAGKAHKFSPQQLLQEILEANEPLKALMQKIDAELE